MHRNNKQKLSETEERGHGKAKNYNERQNSNQITNILTAESYHSDGEGEEAKLDVEDQDSHSYD